MNINIDRYSMCLCLCFRLWSYGFMVVLDIRFSRINLINWIHMMYNIFRWDDLFFRQGLFKIFKINSFHIIFIIREMRENFGLLTIMIIFLIFFLSWYIWSFPLFSIYYIIVRYYSFVILAWLVLSFEFFLRVHLNFE